ncbi:UPF0149 family protein [Photobacterium ganghwense]|uniref:UPF0149 family protein n=1 Tax=Photobacterium ganghwense TaxID=320778 RepID=UPI0039EE3A5E
MSEVKLPTYESLEPMLKEHGLTATPAELHGLLSGMICGGLELDGEQWLAPVCDYANQGEPLTDGAKTLVRAVYDAAAHELSGLLNTLFTSTGAELNEVELTVSLLLPEQDGDLMLRAEALSEWVTNFISGLGLMGLDKKALSEDVTEAIEALEEIAKLGIDDTEDMDEQAMLFDNIAAYVPECVMVCLIGLSQRRDASEAGSDEPVNGDLADDASSAQKPTLH